MGYLRDPVVHLRIDPRPDQTAKLPGLDVYKRQLLRDIMAGETPYILRKHVYASASITGAVLYAYLQDYMNNDAAMLIGAGSVILIRILATRYCWNLPTATKK